MIGIVGFITNRRFLAPLLIVCSLAASPAVFAQNKPRLGILPFVTATAGSTGSSGDGETIATLFSFQSEIMAEFTVVPRTSAVNALIAEQDFQMSGYTDSDTIAGIGRMLNADYVVSGHIRRLGNRNLIITTIVNVETFEQLAGDYRQYSTIEEIRSLLPEITRIVVNASRRDTSRLPNLAIAPFNIANTGVDKQDAETLAQILAVEVSNTGKYTVLPRTTTIQAAIRELEYQMTGATADDEAKALGRAINAEYVLNAEVRSLGTENMFTASILHVEDGSLHAGGYRTYHTIADGLVLMTELALLLTDTAAAAEQTAVREAAEQRQQRQARKTAIFGDMAKFWSVGVSAGSSFADPWVIGTIQGTIALLKHMFLRLGCDVGFISRIENAGYYSLYPFAHIAYFLPFAQKGGLYIGVGGGCMIAEYRFDDLTESKTIGAMDFTGGIIIGDFLDIGYTLRTDFSSINNKFSIGYVYRFK